MYSFINDCSPVSGDSSAERNYPVLFLSFSCKNQINVIKFWSSVENKNLQFHTVVSEADSKPKIQAAPYAWDVQCIVRLLTKSFPSPQSSCWRQIAVFHPNDKFIYVPIFVLQCALPYIDIHLTYSLGGTLWHLMYIGWLAVVSSAALRWSKEKESAANVFAWFSTKTVVEMRVHRTVHSSHCHGERCSHFSYTEMCVRRQREVDREGENGVFDNDLNCWCIKTNGFYAVHVYSGCNVVVEVAKASSRAFVQGTHTQTAPSVRRKVQRTKWWANRRPSTCATTK